MDTRHLFVKNLKRIRHAKGLTQEKLARAMGRSTAYIGGLESTAKWPSAVAIDQIAAALDISVHELFVETDAEAPDLGAELTKCVNLIEEDMVRAATTAIENACNRIRNEYT